MIFTQMKNITQHSEPYKQFDDSIINSPSTNNERVARRKERVEAVGWVLGQGVSNTAMGKGNWHG